MFHVPVEKHGVNGHLRQKGKIAELALGYGGSVGALKSMGALEMGDCGGGTAAPCGCVARFQSHDHAVLVGCRPGSEGLYQAESPHRDTRPPL